MENIYQTFTNDILKRNLVDENTGILYEYLEANARDLEGFEGRSIPMELYYKQGIPSDDFYVYLLTQNGEQSNCLWLSVKNGIKYLPKNPIDISEKIGEGLDTSTEIMSFNIVKDNETLCFRKQVVNCIGAFYEEYMP